MASFFALLQKNPGHPQMGHSAGSYAVVDLGCSADSPRALATPRAWFA